MQQFENLNIIFSDMKSLLIYAEFSFDFELYFF